jgi:hypothetical protein
MSNLDWHFDVYVVPNFRIFTAAEKSVVSAFLEGNADNPEALNRWAIAAGMNASVPAYHMADAMMKERQLWPSWLPDSINKIGQLRQEIERRHCRRLRGECFGDDLTLLGAVVDAYKHTALRDSKRHVTSNRATVVTATGYGELYIYGEGNYVGCGQVVVRLNSGRSRALSGVLQNVIDMWRRVLDRPLEPWGS